MEHPCVLAAIDDRGSLLRNGCGTSGKLASDLMVRFPGIDRTSIGQVIGTRARRGTISPLMSPAMT